MELPMKSARVLRLALIPAAALACLACGKQPPGPPQGEQQEYSYALGVELARGLEPRRDGLDLDQVHQAIDDVLKHRTSQLGPEQARKIIQAYEARHRAAQQQQRQSVAERNLAEGVAFLDRNGRRAGVKTTARGVQYEVLVQGEGPAPIETDQVLLHYSGTLVDGTAFDSSRDQPQPASIAVPLSLPGWREVLPLMPIGSKYRVYVPGPLAYGEQGLGLKVGPQATVIYEIELLGIVR